MGFFYLIDKINYPLDKKLGTIRIFYKESRYVNTFFLIFSRSNKLLLMNFKTIFVSIILICTSALAGLAQTNQLEKAAEMAKEKNKLIFMNFSGSDWCRACMVLKQSILETPEFKSFADKELVLLEVDFPRKKKNRLSKEQTEYNEKLAEKYNHDGQFPTVIILDSDLNIIAKTGYKRLSPSLYIEHIKTLINK